MKIETLKELKALLELCNKQHVREITIDGICMKLEGMPEAPTNTSTNTQIATPDQFTPEEILMWSAHGQDNAS